MDAEDGKTMDGPKGAWPLSRTIRSPGTSMSERKELSVSLTLTPGCRQGL